MDQPDITKLIRSWLQGNNVAQTELFAVLYRQLHKVAAGILRGEPNAATLGPTALVHEVYIRIANSEDLTINDRRHFMSLFATVARHVVIDQAKRRKAQSRGGNLQRVEFEEIFVRTEEDADRILAIDIAMKRLEAQSERLCKVVECLFFAGLTEEETAVVLEISARTVRRDWRIARIRLFDDLHGAR